MSAFEFFFSFYGLLLGLSVAELVGGLEPGSSTAIARGAGPDDEQEALDRAAMEFGTD